MTAFKGVPPPLPRPLTQGAGKRDELRLTQGAGKRDRLRPYAGGGQERRTPPYAWGRQETGQDGRRHKKMSPEGSFFVIYASEDCTGVISAVWLPSSFVVILIVTCAPPASVAVYVVVASSYSLLLTIYSPF